MTLKLGSYLGRDSCKLNALDLFMESCEFFHKLLVALCFSGLTIQTL